MTTQYHSTDDYNTDHAFQPHSLTQINTMAEESTHPKDSTHYLLRSTNAHILNRRALLSYRGFMGLVRIFYNSAMFLIVFGLTIDTSRSTCKMGLYWPVTYLIVTFFALFQLAPHVKGITFFDKYFFGLWTKQRVIAFHQILSLLIVIFSIILPFLWSKTVPKCPLLPPRHDNSSISTFFSPLGEFFLNNSFLQPSQDLTDTLGYNKHVYNFTIFVTVITYLETLLLTPFFLFALHFGKLDYLLRYSPLHNGISTQTIAQLPTFTYHDESTYLDSRLSGAIPAGLVLKQDQIKQIGPICLTCHKHYFLGDEIIRLSCRHDYHAECITAWLKVENCCPCCQLNAIPFENLDPERDYNETSGILGNDGSDSQHDHNIPL